MDTTTKDRTFGERLVGKTFNPSNDSRVDRVKEICAELADILVQEYDATDDVSLLKDTLYRHTIGEILNAQMNVVKFLTLKY